MREIRQSGSEGGVRFNPLLLPYPGCPAGEDARAPMLAHWTECCGTPAAAQEVGRF